MTPKIKCELLYPADEKKKSSYKELDTAVYSDNVLVAKRGGANLNVIHEFGYRNQCANLAHGMDTIINNIGIYSRIPVK